MTRIRDRSANPGLEGRTGGVSAASPLLETRALTREFGALRAVDDLTLRVDKGEIFGLVGPDGAGKTTTLRLLAGLLGITSGEANLAGVDLVRAGDRVKPLIGYMAQQFSLYADLTVWENLVFFADLYGVAGEERQSRLEEALDFSRLHDFRNRRAAHLSGGMQKKLSLASCLLHRPQVLLLDEPTTGVDPVSRREFWDLLARLHLDGTTIVVSTPYMDEAERCHRVGLLYGGRLVRCDTPAAIQRLVPGEMLALQPRDWHKARSVLAAIPGVIEVQSYGNQLRVFVDSARKELPLIENALRSAGIPYDGLRPASPTMEEAFVSLIRRMEA